MTVYTDTTRFDACAMTEDEMLKVALIGLSRSRQLNSYTIDKRELCACRSQAVTHTDRREGRVYKTSHLPAPHR